MDKTIRTIVLRISGGMGNQLFQLFSALYAAKLEKNFNSKIYLDTRFLSSYETSRNLSIDFFLDSFPEIELTYHANIISMLASKYRLSRIIDRELVGYGFVSSVNRLKNFIASRSRYLILDGYFQDPAIASKVINHEKLYSKIETKFGYLKERLQIIPTKKIVGIHIRRGDFVTSKAASSVFLTISIDYYRQAIKKFPGDVVFLVFGDDLTQVSVFAEEINGINISKLSLTTVEEFMLLALCDGFIIANSTFSWWASFIGWSIGKRVIAPSDWYHDKIRNLSNPLLLKHFELIK